MLRVCYIDVALFVSGANVRVNRAVWLALIIILLKVIIFSILRRVCFFSISVS